MTRETQAQRILSLLRSKEWIELPELLSLYIASWRARISELRQQGFWIDCEITMIEGRRHTRYKLIAEPGEMNDARSESDSMVEAPIREWLAP